MWPSPSSRIMPAEPRLLAPARSALEAPPAAAGSGPRRSKRDDDDDRRLTRSRSTTTRLRGPRNPRRRPANLGITGTSPTRPVRREQSSRWRCRSSTSRGWDDIPERSGAMKTTTSVAVSQRAGHGRGARPGSDGRRGVPTRLVLHGDGDDRALQNARDPQAGGRAGADRGRPGAFATLIFRMTISSSRSTLPAP